MPKGKPLHIRVCGIRETQKKTAGHPPFMRVKEIAEPPICGSSLIELEKKLAGIKPKI
jgi:hypothetical protein